MMNISTFINMASKIPSPGQLEGLVTFMKEDEKLRFFPVFRVLPENGE